MNDNMNENANNQSHEIDEITDLNISDLDVQELEHRLELATSAAEQAATWCVGAYQND